MNAMNKLKKIAQGDFFNELEDTPIPYTAEDVKKYKAYLSEEAAQRPPSYLGEIAKGMGFLGPIGAGFGAIRSKNRLKGALVGAGGFGGIGALLGTLGAKLQREEIDRAKKVLKEPEEEISKNLSILGKLIRVEAPTEEEEKIIREHQRKGLI